MGTGKKAFSGANQASVISSILRDDPVPISQIHPLAPRALERIVRTCLAKDPEDRWQTARDVALQLETIATDRSGDVTLTIPARRRAAWAPWALAAGAGALGAGAVLRGAAPAGPSRDAPVHGSAAARRRLRVLGGSDVSRGLPGRPGARLRRVRLRRKPPHLPPSPLRARSASSRGHGRRELRFLLAGRKIDRLLRRRPPETGRARGRRSGHDLRGPSGCRSLRDLGPRRRHPLRVGPGGGDPARRHLRRFAREARPAGPEPRCGPGLLAVLSAGREALPLSPPICGRPGRG